MDIKGHACKDHERTLEDLGEGGEVFLFSIPAGGQRCLVSGLRESQFLFVFGWGGWEKTAGSSFAPQGFLRLGLGGGAEDGRMLLCYSLSGNPERGGAISSSIVIA